MTRVSGRGARGSGCTVSIAEGTETQLVFDGNAPMPAAEVASGVQSLARLALERL